MKKKIIALGLIFIIIGLSFHASAQLITQKYNYKETDNQESENYEIDYFFGGIITGTYEIERYNNKGFLVLENEDNRKTLRVTGIGVYFEYSEAPTLVFGLVITHKVVIVEFYGFRNNGRVFGFGTKNIKYS
jgi:hypothetical protein